VDEPVGFPGITLRFA